MPARGSAGSTLGGRRRGRAHGVRAKGPAGGSVGDVARELDSWRTSIQAALEFFDAVAVAAGGGVDRDFQGNGDLVEGEVFEDFQDDDFALFFGESGEVAGGGFGFFGGRRIGWPGGDEAEFVGIDADFDAAAAAGEGVGLVADHGEEVGLEGADGGEAGAVLRDLDEDVLQDFFRIVVGAEEGGGEGEEAGRVGVPDSVEGFCALRAKAARIRLHQSGVHSAMPKHGAFGCGKAAQFLKK